MASLVAGFDASLPAAAAVVSQASRANWAQLNIFGCLPVIEIRNQLRVVHGVKIAAKQTKFGQSHIRLGLAGGGDRADLVYFPSANELLVSIFFGLARLEVGLEVLEIAVDRRDDIREDF